MKRRAFVLSTAAGLGLGLPLGRPRPAHAAKTLRLLTPEADPGQIQAWNAVFEDFTAKKNKDITVKGEFASWDDTRRKIAADIAAGRPPEIVAGSSKPDFVAAETKRGLVVDMAPVLEAVGRADFNPAALKVWQYRGIQMAIPYGLQWPVFWYRKDLLAEKGLKPPVTWDDYRTVAEKLTNPAKGVYGAVFSSGRNWGTQLLSLIYIWSAGGMLFDEKLNVVFDSPETRRAMQFYGEMATRFSPPDVGQYGLRETFGAYVTGKAATTVYWGRVLSHLYAQAPQLIPNTATSHVPRDRQHRTTLHFDEFYVHRTPSAADAIEVVKFMLQPEQVMRLLSPSVPLVIPTQRAVEPLYAQHEWIKANPDIVKVLITPNEYAVAPTHEGPRHPFNYKYEAVEAKNILPDCVQKIVIGKEPVAKAVEWAHKQMVEATKDIKD